MLPHVTITSYPCSILHQDTLLMVFLGDDIHHSCYGIRAIEGTRCSFYNLYFLDVLWVDECKIILSTHVAMDPLPINQDKDIGIA